MIKFPPPPVTPSTTPLPEIIQVKYTFFHKYTPENLMNVNILMFNFFSSHPKEGSERDDVVKDDIKQMQDVKRDPKKSLTVNGVMVSSRG